MAESDELAAAIDALSEQWLGKHGVVSIADEYDQAGAHIVVFVTEPPDDARRNLPTQFHGFPVLIKKGGPIKPHDRNGLWYRAKR